jgi:hypothetical protein
MTPTFSEGAIVRIKDYIFEDGTTRDKYLIVLYKNNLEAIIIHALTTSKQKFTVEREFSGCHIYKKGNIAIPYYLFPENKILDDESQFFFDVDTYVFFLNNTTFAKIEDLQKYDNQPFGLIELGKLSAFELGRLIKCILKSDFVPENIKNILK